jgi:hypothetical protein
MPNWSFLGYLMLQLTCPQEKELEQSIEIVWCFHVLPAGTSTKPPMMQSTKVDES